MQHTGQAPADADLHARVTAALAAGRELGPEYDEQIAGGLVDRARAQRPRDWPRSIAAVRDNRYVRLGIVSGLAIAGLAWGYAGDDGAAFPGHDPWAVVAIAALAAHVLRSLWTRRGKP
ncbi:hypothetical protein [Streptomonospora arabica]|uniref:DUF1707 domain-containing protein n=1 Tax=Streptomonospora arabica TaxID=412417 RepID=A0ABV9SNB6_9ACTN